MVLKEDDNMVKTIDCARLDRVRKAKTTDRERETLKNTCLNKAIHISPIIM